MNWKIYNIFKAKDWMLKTGMDHIEANLFAEGGELIFEAKFGDGCDTIEDFKLTLKRICYWDDDTIEEAIEEIVG